MNTKRQVHPTFEALLKEHREVMKHINDLREWVKEIGELGVPHFGELGTRLQPLRDELSRHFAEEEEGGYLSVALSRAPRFSREAEELQEQHAQFLKDLNTLIDKLHESEPPFSSWQQACAEFEEILTRIRRHEGRENAIVQAAFETDIGEGD